MIKKILIMLIKDEDLVDIKVGDIIYFNGYIVICCDVVYCCLIEGGCEFLVDVCGGVILYVGFIVCLIKGEDDKFEMVFVGLIISMCMEKFEKEFIVQIGVKLIVGKGGMGKGIEEGCVEYKVLYCVFFVGCVVVVVVCVEEIEDV